MKKYFGNISLDGIKQTKVELPSKFTEHEKYGNQLSVDATMFDDGGISISIWNKDTEQRIQIGNLRVSKYQIGDVQEAEAKGADLPF